MLRRLVAMVEKAKSIDKIRVIIRSEPFIPAEQIPAIEKYGKVHHILKRVHCYSLDMPPKDIQKLRAYKWVKSVEPSGTKYPTK